MHSRIVDDVRCCRVAAGSDAKEFCMLKRFTLGAVAAATALTALPAAADAHRSGAYYRDGYYSQGYTRHRSGDYYGRAYHQRNYRYGDRYYGHGHRCGSGTTGTILGAVAGGLIGREVDRSSSRYRYSDGTTGLIVGGALGAVAGRAIDRKC
jgi:hypothetical protein